MLSYNLLAPLLLPKLGEMLKPDEKEILKYTLIFNKTTGEISTELTTDKETRPAKSKTIDLQKAFSTFPGNRIKNAIEKENPAAEIIFLELNTETRTITKVFLDANRQTL